MKTRLIEVFWDVCNSMTAFWTRKTFPIRELSHQEWKGFFCSMAIGVIGLLIAYLFGIIVI